MQCFKNTLLLLLKSQFFAWEKAISRWQTLRLLDQTPISWSDCDIERETVSPLLNTLMLLVEIHGAGCDKEREKYGIWPMEIAADNQDPAGRIGKRGLDCKQCRVAILSVFSTFLQREWMMKRVLLYYFYSLSIRHCSDVYKNTLLLLLPKEVDHSSMSVYFMNDNSYIILNH